MSRLGSLNLPYFLFRIEIQSAGVQRAVLGFAAPSSGSAGKAASKCACSIRGFHFIVDRFFTKLLKLSNIRKLSRISVRGLGEVAGTALTDPQRSTEMIASALLVWRADREVALLHAFQLCGRGEVVLSRASR